MFFIGMKNTIPITTSAKVAEGNPQMIFTESQTKEKAFDREKMTDNQTGLSMSASLNRMSALLQQFWNTPMYPEAWVSSSSSFSSSSASSATTDSASTSALGSSTTNTNMGKRCRKLSTHDIAHCGGSGVCARCNGNKRYFDDSPYVNH